MLIEIEKIEVGERLRTRLDPVKLRQLADDMEHNGQLQEIIVSVSWETNSRGSMLVEKAALIAGYRRLEAAKLLGWKTIRCVWQFDGNVDPNNEIDRLRLEYSENELREDFTEMERIAFGVKIRDRIAAEARERMLSGKRFDYEYDPETGYKVWHEDDVEITEDITAPDSTEENTLASSCVAIGTDPSANLNEGMDRASKYTGGKASGFAAKKIGMSENKFRQGEYVLKHGTDEQHSAIDRGEASIYGVYSELRQKPLKTASTEIENVVDTTPDAPLRATPSIQSDQEDEKQPVVDSEPEKTKTHEAYITHEQQEFNTHTPDGKIAELQRQLKEERARTADAEAKLAREKELRQKDMSYYTSTIDMLTNQLEIANARISELEGKYEQDKHTS